MRTIAVLAVTLVLASYCPRGAAVPTDESGWREKLDRGVIARPVAGGKVYVGWRLLESDPAGVAFNVYRRTAGGKPVKLNEKPIRRTTDFVDTSAKKGTEQTWFVRPVVEGEEGPTDVRGTVTVDGQPLKGAVVEFLRPGEQGDCAPRATTDDGGNYRVKVQGSDYVVTIIAKGEGRKSSKPTLGARATLGGDVQPYISIKLDGDHTFQKVGIADLDGDRRYDFVIKQPNANVDPYSAPGYWKRSPGTYKIEAYRHDGKFLWRLDLGWSIEQGIWYSPYVVYDLDGDGKAEVVLKTGQGDPRDNQGRVQSGAEHLTILEGVSGKPITRVDWPSRDGFREAVSNDLAAYNYYCRNQLCVAYLDGQTPSLLVERGTYNLQKLVAYQFRGGGLKEQWRWDNAKEPRNYWGQGAHWMHTADVDGDGRDEVLLGSSVIDHDGTALWSTGLGHPDHFYIGDVDPARPGLEIYYGIEPGRRQNTMCLVDAKTGKILWGHDQPTRHVHSAGLCSDVDPAHPGSECYSGERDFKDKRWLRNSKGRVLSTEDLGSLAPRAAYWDADLQRELLVGGRIFNYGDPKDAGIPPKIEGHIAAVADVLGDWREEIITSVPGELRIYTTTIPAADRRVCLMQDPIYRTDVVSAAMGYFQVPMTSYDLATGKR